MCVCVCIRTIYCIVTVLHIIHMDIHMDIWTYGHMDESYYVSKKEKKCVMYRWVLSHSCVVDECCHIYTHIYVGECCHIYIDVCCHIYTHIYIDKCCQIYMEHVVT